MEAQYPTLMEVTGGTPGWDPFGLIPIYGDKSHLSKGWSQELVRWQCKGETSPPFVRGLGDSQPICSRLSLWLLALRHQTQPHPGIPDHRKLLGCQPCARQARGIASVALPDPAHWPCPAGAAASPEHGEASVPRDAALLSVHRQAGKCECLRGPTVGPGSEPGGARGSEKSIGASLRGHGCVSWSLGCPGWRTLHLTEFCMLPRSSQVGGPEEEWQGGIPHL